MNKSNFKMITKHNMRRMMFSIQYTLLFSTLACKAKDSDKSNQDDVFDGYFPRFTTAKLKEAPIYKMYMWRNKPTAFTLPPPPKRSRKRVTQSTTTEEPDDGEGDFKIIPVAKPVSNGHPFLDKDGKRGKKVN